MNLMELSMLRKLLNYQNLKDKSETNMFNDKNIVYLI